MLSTYKSTNTAYKSENSANYRLFSYTKVSKYDIQDLLSCNFSSQFADLSHGPSQRLRCQYNVSAVYNLIVALQMVKTFQQ